MNEIINKQRDIAKREHFRQKWIIMLLYDGVVPSYYNFKWRTIY